MPKSSKKTTKKPIEIETERLISFLRNKQIDEDKLNIALDLIKDIAFMTIKTCELKSEVELYGMTEEYQNGQFQKGRKKSASLEAYLNMTKQKSALIKQLTDLLPDDTNLITPKEDDFDIFLKERNNKNELYH